MPQTLKSAVLHGAGLAAFQETALVNKDHAKLIICIWPGSTTIVAESRKFSVGNRVFFHFANFIVLLLVNHIALSKVKLLFSLIEVTNVIIF